LLFPRCIDERYSHLLPAWLKSAERKLFPRRKIEGIVIKSYNLGVVEELALTGVICILLRIVAVNTGICWCESSVDLAGLISPTPRNASGPLSISVFMTKVERTTIITEQKARQK
jgi:hypothetical protein